MQNNVHLIIVLACLLVAISSAQNTGTNVIKVKNSKNSTIKVSVNSPTIINNIKSNEESSKVIFQILNQDKTQKIDVQRLASRLNKIWNNEIDRTTSMEYAKVIADIYKANKPDATIELNKDVYGIISKTQRKVDLLITNKLLGSNILLAVKLLPIKRPLKKEEIRYVSELVKDIQASKGVIICNGSVPEDVADYSKEKLIDVFKLRDIPSNDVAANLVKIPVVWTERKPYLDYSFSYQIEDESSFSEDQLPRNLRECKFTYNDGQTFYNPMDYFIDLWNNDAISKNVETPHYVSFSTANLKLRIASKEYLGEVNEVKICYQTIDKSYIKYFSPEEFLAIENVIIGGIELGSIKIKPSYFTGDPTWSPIDKSKFSDMRGMVVFYTVAYPKMEYLYDQNRLIVH